MSSAKVAAALLVAAAALGVAAEGARADGDPASDYLISQQVFFGFGQTASAEQQAELSALVRTAKAKGFEIRIALIGQRTDLGAVPVLWRQPQTYARFLGQELARFYPRRLLVVMPNGYGLYGVDEPDLTKEKATLHALPAPGANLLAAAEVAVQRLALLHDVRVEPTPQGGGSGSTTRDRLKIVAVVLVVLVGLALAKGIQLLRR